MYKPCIMCVDDDNIILESLKAELSLEFGGEYSIETAQSGQEALNMYNELLSEGIDIPLLIADYLMPNMNGDELLKKICQANPKTVTMLLTGQATLKGVTESVNNARVYRYISKPWKKDNLVSLVNQCLEYWYKQNLKVENNALLEDINKELENHLKNKFKKPDNETITINLENISVNFTALIENSLNQMENLLKSLNLCIDMISLIKIKISESNNNHLTTSIRELNNLYSKALDLQNSLPFESDNNKTETNITRSKDKTSDTLLENERNIVESLKKIAAWNNEEILLFDYEDILFFSSQDGVTYLNTKDKTHRTRDTLEILETRLSSHNFYRCHRGFLINLKYVSKIIPWIDYNYISILDASKHEIPISRNRLKEMKKILGIKP